MPHRLCRALFRVVLHSAATACSSAPCLVTQLRGPPVSLVLLYQVIGTRSLVSGKVVKTLSARDGHFISTGCHGRGMLAQASETGCWATPGS